MRLSAGVVASVESIASAEQAAVLLAAIVVVTFVASFAAAAITTYSIATVSVATIPEQTNSTAKATAGILLWIFMKLNFNSKKLLAERFTLIR